MLVANKSWVKHNTVGYKFADTSIGRTSLCTCTSRLNMIFNLALAEWRDTAAIPTSLMARKAWLPPIKAGGIGSFRKAKITVDARGSAVVGLPAVGTAAIQVSARGAAGVWLSISGTATIQVSGRGTASNLLSAKGSAGITIAGRATATQLQHIRGTAEIELGGRAEPTLIMWIAGSTAEQGLTVDGIARGVWSAQAASNNAPGTMGEKLNAAGAAADPWATPEGQSVLNNTGLVPATV